MLINIAIVDDDVEAVKNVKNLLTEYGNTKGIEIITTIFYNAEDFLKEYEINKFDLLFLDINLPNLSGMDLAEIIRKSDDDIEIILELIMSNMHY